jgi:hypothetical protein
MSYTWTDDDWKMLDQLVDQYEIDGLSADDAYSRAERAVGQHRWETVVDAARSNAGRAR